MLMRFKRQRVLEKLHSLKFIFNCHVKTIALMICLKNLFVQVCAIPTHRSRSRPILALGFKHVTLATRSEESTGKVKYFYTSIVKGNEINPLIIILSHQFHSNSHRIRSSTKIIKCTKCLV